MPRGLWDQPSHGADAEKARLGASRRPVKPPPEMGRDDPMIHRARSHLWRTGYRAQPAHLAYQRLPFCRKLSAAKENFPPWPVKEHGLYDDNHYSAAGRGLSVCMGRSAMFKTDLLFNACSRCSAWPMSANVAESKWGSQKICLRCSRCGHQDTVVTKIRSRRGGVPRHFEAAALKRDLPR
jgi:hypothetical protein